MIPSETFPHPKTPWLFPEDVFNRLQSETSGDKKFAKVELDPSSPLWSFVHRYFGESRPRECVVDKIYALFNPTLTNAFKSEIAKNEAEASNSFFGRKWPKTDSLDEIELRVRALDRWKQLTEPYSPFEIHHPDRRVVKFSQTRLFFGWHGAPEKSCDSIAKSGFTIIGKHPKAQTKSSDIGYFGSGVYFTTHSGYAVQTYGFNGNVLLAAVVAREPFPVVADRKCIPPDQPKDMRRLKGRGGYETYNTHFISAVPCYPKNPYCSIYFPCSKGETPILDEVVVFYPSQALPIVHVKLRAVADLYQSPGNDLKVSVFVAKLDAFLNHPDVQNHPEIAAFFKGEKQFLIAIDSGSSISLLPELHQDFYSWVSTFFDQAGKIKALEVQDLLPKISKSSVPTFNQDDLFLFLREGKLDIVNNWLGEDFSRSYAMTSLNPLDIYRDTTYKRIDGWTIAHEAARSGHLSFLKQLIEKRSSFLEKKTKDGLTLLHAAAHGGHIEVIGWLLEKKPSLSDQRAGDPKFGYLPALIAALNGHRQVVAWLSADKILSPEMNLKRGSGLKVDFDQVVHEGKPDLTKQKSILTALALLSGSQANPVGLTLANCHVLTSELLHPLLRSGWLFFTLVRCPNIKELDLSSYLIDIIMIRDCPHLQKIAACLDKGYEHQDEGCFELKRCPMVTELSLKSSKKTTVLLQNNVELVHLNLDVPDTSSFEISGSPKLDLEKIKGMKLVDALRCNQKVESLYLSSKGPGDDKLSQASYTVKTILNARSLWLTDKEINDIGFICLFDALQSKSTLKILLMIHEKDFEKNGAYRALSQFLKANDTLERLTLSHLSQDLILEGGFDEIMDGLCENQGLRELDLSDSSDLFLISPSSLKRVLEKNRTLRSLRLQRTEASCFSKELGEGLAQNTTLTELDLSQNPMGFSNIVDLFSKVQPSLVKVSLSQCDLVRMSLGPVISCLKHVQILDLSGNKINDEGMSILADGLKADPCLVELDLRSNQISSSKLQTLVSGLEANTHLRVIEFAHNEIDDRGLAFLIKLFEQKPYMTELRLSRNQISEKGAALIADLLNRNTLTSLDLSGNPIGDDGAVKIAAALHQNTSLQTLCLSECKIGDRGGEAFLSAQKHNTTLVKFYLSDNPMNASLYDQVSSPFLWNNLPEFLTKRNPG